MALHSKKSRTIWLPSHTMVDTTCRCKCAGSTTVYFSGATHYIDMESLKKRESTRRHHSRYQLDLLYHQASSQDISAKHFLKAAGFFRGCAVTVVNCEQSVGCHFLSFIPLGLSALHAPSVATSKASTLSVVVIHAPLGEDVLPPCSELPIASVVCAGREHSVAILQILREHADGRLADDLQMAEETVLDVRTILIVEAVWRVSWLGAQPTSQTPREEYCISVDLDGVVCRLPPAHVTNLHPNLVENPPIDPGARVLSLQLVELAEFILHLDGHVTVRVVDWHRHVAEHVPLLASENTLTLSCNNVQ